MYKFFIFIFLLSTINLVGQDTIVESSKGKHFLGFNAGSSTGLGLSYKYVKNKFGIQITGIPTVRDQDIWTSSGLALTYRIIKNQAKDNKFTFLLYAGSHYIYNKKEYGDYYYYDDVGTVYSQQDQHTINSALGIGFEYLKGRNFTFSLMSGYGIKVRKGAQNTGAQTIISGEVGLHYRL